MSTRIDKRIVKYRVLKAEEPPANNGQPPVTTPEPSPRIEGLESK